MSLSLWAKGQFFGYPVQISTSLDLIKDVRNIALADVDADGDMDIIGYSLSEPNVVWFENVDGLGNFGGPYKLAETYNLSGPNHLELFNLNGDAFPDLLTVRSNIQQTRWYTNPGKPPYLCENFEGGTGQQLGIITSTAVGDIDGDGHDDVLMGFSSSAFGWLRNDGNGSLQDYEILSDVQSLGWTYLNLVDIDGDANPDLVGNLGDTIGWWENTGSGLNMDTHHFIGSVEGSIRQIRSADVNGDGYPDVLASTNDSTWWWPNTDGNGIFGEKGTLVDSETYTLADLDNDGDLDLITVHGYFHLVLMENLGGGNFSSPDTLFRCFAGIYDIKTADVNGDGWLDIAVSVDDAVNSQSQLLVFRSKGDMKFENPLELMDVARRQKFLELSDLDNDGIPEVISGHGVPDRISWQKYDPALPGGFSNSTNLRIKAGEPIRGAVGDLNHDGHPDLLASFTGYRLSSILRPNEELYFDLEQTIFQSNSTNSIKSIWVVDLDGDGLNDIIASVGSWIRWYRCIEENAVYAPPVNLNSVGNSHRYLILTDFDNDGDLDLVAATSSSSPNKVFCYINDSNNNFSGPIDLLTFENMLSGFMVEDVNGDGLKDIILHRWGIDGTAYNWIDWYERLNAGIDFGEKQEINAIEMNGVLFQHQVSLVDLNQDGNLDIVFPMPVIPDNVMLAFQKNDGSGNFSPVEFVSGILPNFWNFELADFDRDGDLDMIGYRLNSTQGNNFYIENIQDFPRAKAITFFDTNENGIMDSNEPPLNLQRVEVDPNEMATYTNNQGYAFFALAEGTYELMCHPTEQFTFTTAQSVTIESLPDSVTQVSFGLKGIIQEVLGQVNATSAPTRCGFEVPFWIAYQNTGTFPASGYISFELDSLTSLVSANPAPDSISGGILYWFYEDLFPTYFGQIHLTLQMPGVEHIGEYLSFSTTMSMVSEDGSLQYNATSGYRPQVNCAYDPNDKLVEPNIPDFENYTLFGDTLHYTIRFQNTGTDTAFTVRLEDVLDKNLDWSSLQVTGASHAFKTKLDMRSGKLTFTFENILLPDSTTNEVESHGYIRYLIQHKENLPENTWISNTASIFFDFNPPIITNTVYNLMVSEYPLLIRRKNPNCSGDSTGRLEVLFSLPGSEFQWWNGETGLVVDSLSSGEYQLSVTLFNGSVLDTVLYLVDPDTVGIELLELQHEQCYGDESGFLVVRGIGGTLPYSYLWSNGVTNDIADGLGVGTFEVVLTDKNGCVQHASFEIEGQDAPLTAELSSSPASVGKANGSVSALASGGSPPYAYSWNTNPVQLGPVADSLAAGSYIVEVTDADDCKFLDTIVVESVLWETDLSKEELELITSTGDEEADFIFKVMPNPSTEIITIEVATTKPGNREIQVQNTLGQILQTYKVEQQREVWKLSLPVGVYMVALMHKDVVVKTERVIIVK